MTISELPRVSTKTMGSGFLRIPSCCATSSRRTFSTRFRSSPKATLTGIEPPDAVCSEVGNDIAPYPAIGNHQALVVECRDGGRNQVHALDRAFDPAGDHVVIDIVGPVDQDHPAGGEIRQRIL